MIPLHKLHSSCLIQKSTDPHAAAGNLTITPILAFTEVVHRLSYIVPRELAFACFQLQKVASLNNETTENKSSGVSPQVY